MSFFHANHQEALNQNLAELEGQIRVSFEFFPPEPLKWNKLCGNPLTD